MKRYPVSDDVAKQIDLFIKTLECSSTKNRRTYLSGPMTTGRRYLELITTTQTTPSLIKDICMRENLRLLDTHAQYQRQLNKDETIINPGRLHLPNFSTNEYMHLWLRIITNHVHTVVALLIGNIVSVHLSKSVQHSIKVYVYMTQKGMQ